MSTLFLQHNQAGHSIEGSDSDLEIYWSVQVGWVTAGHCWSVVAGRSVGAGRLMFVRVCAREVRQSET